MWRPSGLALLSVVALAGCVPASWGAAALLHPQRRPITSAPVLDHRELDFTGADGVSLRGWLFPAAGQRRGVTVVYLHGIGDNRASGTWIAERLTRRGFDVLAYDGRAHGASGGEACTYGVMERGDLRRGLDAAGAKRAVLLGVSLGGAVALQAAPEDDRVAGVVGVAIFSDLWSIARDRAPPLTGEGWRREALALAEREAHFSAAEASPVAAAPRIRVPVLLVHGRDDGETSPIHSERVYAALAGPRRLILVPGAGHGDALGKAWSEVEAWIDLVAGVGPDGPSSP